MTEQIKSIDQLFKEFCATINFQEILQLFNSICSKVGADPDQYDGLYSSLKNSLKMWKATSLFKLLDARASLPEYEGQRACAGKRVMIVGAGPVGLRAAIEARLLGAKVDVVEKRTDFSRNNCVHLWPFCITDLRKLGAKILYSRFAYGTIEHISIKFLQSILVKVCLLLGIKVHRGVSFDEIIEPKDKDAGWNVSTTPECVQLSSYNFDVVLAADGNTNTLPGFRSKLFHPKLALGVTINFVNHNTTKECAVRELGGINVLDQQEAFMRLATEHGIFLENMVYFKDETHYFVMTALKKSLLQKGVLKEDFKKTKDLLKKENIEKTTLESFAIQAATVCSGLDANEVECAVNHHGDKDIALFDFTTMHSSENASRIIERKGKRLLLCVAGDTLLQPFWPTGTGIGRGFFGVFDAAWMIKGFCSKDADPIKLLEEREAILTLLPQVGPWSLKKNYDQYTINPITRYLNLYGITPRADVSQYFDNEVIVCTLTLDEDKTSLNPNMSLSIGTEQLIACQSKRSISSDSSSDHEVLPSCGDEVLPSCGDEVLPPCTDELVCYNSEYVC